MPSKNSVNRPKLTVNVNRKARQRAQKRAASERRGLLQPARSSSESKSGQVKSVPLDLYFQKNNNKSSVGAVTTKTLSKKRAKKIERNLKYAEQRRLLTDVHAQLDTDDTVNPPKVGGALQQVKTALWTVLADTRSEGFSLPTGQGTTLGSPNFL